MPGQCQRSDCFGWLGYPRCDGHCLCAGALSVFGRRVPIALKVFLLTLAIFDDLAAIVIIALFYSGDLSLAALGFAGGALALAVGMNVGGVARTSSYILLGIVLWVAVLKSGVHATLARGAHRILHSHARRSRKFTPAGAGARSSRTCGLCLLPIFAFANAGLSFSGMTLNDFANPVAIGVIGGLFVGKPVGILSFIGIAVMFKWAQLPERTNWLQVVGVSFACGIGFTMSLFIAGLAFEHGGGEYLSVDRLGIVVGSMLSAVAALLFLQLSLPKASEAD